MFQAHDWEEQAFVHASASVKLRKLAERRLTAMEAQLDHIHSKFNPDNPETLEEYLSAVSAAVPPEVLQSLATTIHKAVSLERQATGQHLHDINALSAEAYRLGYRLVPRKEIGADTSDSRTGVSQGTINAMRSAIGASILNESN